MAVISKVIIGYGFALAVTIYGTTEGFACPL
jgi:hypothetical protein